MKGIKIDVDGTVIGVEFNDDKPVWEQVNDALGSEIFEIVRTGLNMPENRVILLVDESGLCKGLKYNPVATDVAESFGCYPGIYLVGPVLIMAEGMTDDGPDLVDMPLGLYDNFLHLTTIISKCIFKQPISLYDYMAMSFISGDNLFEGPFIIKVEDKEKIEEFVANPDPDLLKTIIIYGTEDADKDPDNYVGVFIQPREIDSGSEIIDFTKPHVLH